MRITRDSLITYGPALLACLLTAALHTASFPFAFVDGQLWSLSESAYLFLVPLAVWMYRKPCSLPLAFVAGATAGFLSWTVLLWWLRHVTLFGTLFVSLFLALFIGVWALAAAWALPRARMKPALIRLLILAGLAGFWVLLEWLRSWIFYGFPWLPLAASQWDSPAMLQLLPYTGQWGLSFLLVYFNLALAAYGVGLFKPRRGAGWYRRLSPELYSAFGLLAFAMFLLLPARRERQAPEPLMQAGFVQPYIPQELKWNEAAALENIEILGTWSRYAKIQESELLLWPEASTPWPVLGDTQMQQWAEDLSSELQIPILMGNVGVIDQPNGDDLWYNGVFVVQPDTGLDSSFYAKQKLVPFGEFNPLSMLPFELGFMPNGTFTPGTDTRNIPLMVGDRSYHVGPLVCYEDIFPSLARRSVAKHVDFLFVATNNAWYGEEAGAYQHAVHSILRAVETRRPVLRSGNGGWSGWIDEYGKIAFLSVRPKDGVYFRGTDSVTIFRDPAWAGRLTPYVQLGDWFVTISALLVFLAFLAATYVKDDPALAPDTEKEVDARQKARELLRRSKLRRF